MIDEIDAQILGIEQIMLQASDKDRLRYYPIVQRMVASIKARGMSVPLNLSRLNADLTEEAYDEMFDNMPL